MSKYSKATSIVKRMSSGWSPLGNAVWALVRKCWVLVRWVGTNWRSWLRILSSHYIHSQGVSHVNTIDHRGILGLWSLGRPYHSAQQQCLGEIVRTRLSGNFSAAVLCHNRVMVSWTGFVGPPSSIL